jgi:predicted deacylase
MQVEDIYRIEVPFRGTYRLRRLRFGQGSPRLVVVGGLHGNELNSVYALNLLASFLRAQAPQGTVDLIPLANAFGVEEGRKQGPFDDQDLNQVFPGDPQGTAMQRVAHELLEATVADVCVDLHTGSMLVDELPQVRVADNQEELTMARAMGLPLVWRRGPRAGDGTQLVDAWRAAGCTAFRVTGARGATLDKKAGAEIAAGLSRLMAAMGMIRSPSPGRVSALVDDEQVHGHRSTTGGFFVAEVNVGDRVAPGDLLGRVVAPVGGTPLEDVRAVCEGLVTTVRRYPMSHAQELLLRVAECSEHQPPSKS